MIGITIREDAYNAILASLAAGARLFQPQRTISGYRIWLPRKACSSDWRALRRLRSPCGW